MPAPDGCATVVATGCERSLRAPESRRYAACGWCRRSFEVRRKLTLRDLAEQLGVSRSTVSRALRDDPQIAVGTRERVRALASSLGYLPDAAARALTRRRAQAVGLMLPRSSELVFGNPYFSELLLGVSLEAEAAGYPLLLSTSPEPDFGAWLREGRVDGLILLGSSVQGRDVPELNRLIRAGYPVVAIHAAPRALRAVTIGSNERAGVWQALAHLQQSGHRRVAFLAGPRGSRYAERRVRAFRTGLEAFGLEVDDALLVPTDDSRAGGEHATAELLRRGHGFDAVLADNDLVALGAYRALAGAGLPVPDAVSVIGFDDTPLASVVRPALSSVRQPTRRLGELAFTALLTLMAGGTVASTRLATRLVVRESTAPKSVVRGVA